MKKIGLIGGMSWESTKVYYEILNETVKARLGGFHSARCVMDSVDFAEIEALQHRDDWDALNELMATSASNLEKAGAEVIILCTNTMHLCSAAIERSVGIPFLHIAQATGKRIEAQGLQKVLLLGTRFTMEKEFFGKMLADKFGLGVIIPGETDRQIVHDVIYQELVKGEIKSDSREQFQRIIQTAQHQEGAEGVILGCTEIPLLIQQSDVAIPIFDTTRIHAEAAVDFALT